MCPLPLIAGTYVALTLQGPPPSVASVPLQPLPTDLSPNHRTAPGEAPPPPPTPPTGSITPTQRITGPKPLQVCRVLSFLMTVIYNRMVLYWLNGLLPKAQNDYASLCE